MQGFLSEVARDLYERYGSDLSSLHILFPSQRARLFFLDALSEIADRPLWQPRWMTVDDLMSEISGLRSADRLRLVAELYSVYKEYHNESFDRFYFWGDMLLSDFDTVDKYLINAEALFSNIGDLKELESDISYLSEEQRKIVERFWREFAAGAETSEVKRNFFALWRTLTPIYGKFRDRLTSQGMAYMGMMHRAAADIIREGRASLPRRHYVIAGFNALSECEKRLFDHLKNTAEVDFYWDFDDYYVSNPEQEAGMFVRENLRRYPPAAMLSHDNLRRKREISAVSAISNVVQCKYAGELLRNLAASAPLDKDTAVVLTDETLLEPVLYSLSEEAARVNVTMGYPLMQTPAYSFVERLMELQTRSRSKDGVDLFYHADVTGLLTHPYIADDAAAAQLAGDVVRSRRVMVPQTVFAGHQLFARIFRRVADASGLPDYLSDIIASAGGLPCEDADAARRREFLSVLSENIARLRNTLADCNLTMELKTCASLIRRHLRTVRVPFEGEPLEGVQIMGILETRNLDFRNVILLSMDDDNFPGNRIAQSSFIPYNLRFAYGLPTPEHHEGVYAYYFYRLIQRCENLSMVYCSRADEKGTGEPSRYIRQLEYESGLAIRKVEAGVDVNLIESIPLEIPKTGVTAERLLRFLDGVHPAKLSPTAFSHYVECPMKFWFMSVARMSPEEELSDTVDNRIFGNIFHKAAENIYSTVIGECNAGALLHRAAARADAEVVRAVNSEYLQDESADPENYEGDVQLVRGILTRCLRNVLEYDAAHDDFAVEALEADVACDFPFTTAGGRSAAVRFAGKSDRIDRMDDGSVRIVDYKTGSPVLEFRSVGELFDSEAGTVNVNLLKTIMYAMMYSRSAAGRGDVAADVRPALYYVRSMKRDDEASAPYLVRGESRNRATAEPYAAYAGDFEDILRSRLAELFDFDTPFRCCTNPKTCEYCDFAAVCDR